MRGHPRASPLAINGHRAGELQRIAETPAHPITKSVLPASGSPSTRLLCSFRVRLPRKFGGAYQRGFVIDPALRR